MSFNQSAESIVKSMEDNVPSSVPPVDCTPVINRNDDDNDDENANPAAAAVTLECNTDLAGSRMDRLGCDSSVGLIRLDEETAELFDGLGGGDDGECAGYTPLNDMNMSCSTGIAIGMAMNGGEDQTGAADPAFIYTEYAPMTMNDDDDDDDDDSEFIFSNPLASGFSNPLASSPIPSPNQDNDNDNENEQQIDGQTTSKSEFDYKALADQVLRSLDDEYRCSVVGVRPTIHNTDIHKHSNHKYHNQQEHDTNDEKNHPTDTHDNNHNDDTHQINSKCDEPSQLQVPHDNHIPPPPLPDTTIDTNTFPTTFVEQTTESVLSTSTSNPPNDTPSIPSPKPKKKDTPIDKRAIAKAVNNIRLKSPNLTATLDNWKAPPQHAHLFQSKTTTTTTNAKKQTHHHPLIPSIHLKAFHRSTVKANRATSNLTRSATIAEAFVRLFLPTAAADIVDTTALSSSTFILHVVGVDHVECDSVSTVRKTFKSFVRWLDGYVRDSKRRMKQTGGATTSEERSNTSCIIEHVRIELLGPNVPAHAVTNQPIHLITNTDTTTNDDNAADNADAARFGGLLSCTVVCKNCLYHDYLNECDDNDNNNATSPAVTSTVSIENKGASRNSYPNMAIAFNAGIWGYDYWKPTLEALCRLHRPIPFVITAYTTQEAEDDAEVIAEVISKVKNGRSTSGEEDGTTKQVLGRVGSVGPSDIAVDSKCLWEVEVNPFGSRKKRDTYAAPKDRLYFENGAWQAWRLGGCGGG